jgi:tRNA(Ile)-lysidine synthetase-like protein
VQAALGAAWPDLARERAGAVDFAGPAWRRLHPALQREAIRQAHARLARNADRQSGETLGLEHVEQARALIERGVGRRLDLPGGVVLTVGYGGSFTLGDPPELDGPQLLLDSVRLPDTGCVQLDAEWMLDIALVQSASTRPAGSSEIDLDADRIQGPLIARRRRPGDWIRLRRRGSRRLQDLFVDLKVPRALRDAWPIVATSDAIIWVVGLRVDDTFLATPDSRRIIQIRLRRAWGGPQALSD